MPPTLPPDNPADVYNRVSFGYACTTVVLILSILSYVLRIGARRRSGQPLKWDDHLMGIGLFVSFLPAISEYVLLANGAGHHIWNVPPKQLYNFSRAAFALQRANQISLGCVKISILLFYLRLFPSRKFAYWAYANMAFTVCWAISTWIVNLTTCTPVAYFYDKTIPGGTCKNQDLTGAINGGLSLLGDILILILPIPMIWQLQINLRRKVALLGIFLLGTFVCISSAIRIVSIIQYDPSDPTFDQVYAASWTYMEMGIAVISGNLPLLRPYFESFFRITNQTFFTKTGGSFPTKNNFSRNDRMTGNISHISRSKVEVDGFERISDDVTITATKHGSDVELCDRTATRSQSNHGIVVKTDLTVTSESVSEIEGKRKNDDW